MPLCYALEVRICRTILVVDDDERIRGLFSRLLIDDGHVALLAKDGAEALVVLAAEHPCLIFLDINMPIMGGLEFISRYENKAHIPIIVVSATITAENALPGVAGYLPKPFTIAQMRDAISIGELSHP